MRLSYNTYPILSQIESGMISSIDGGLLSAIKNSGNHKTWLGGICVASLESSRGEINFLTKPFRDARVVDKDKWKSTFHKGLSGTLTLHSVQSFGGDGIWIRFSKRGNIYKFGKTNHKRLCEFK